jgi:hypothetical protein
MKVGSNHRIRIPKNGKGRSIFADGLKSKEFIPRRVDGVRDF